MITCTLYVRFSFHAEAVRGYMNGIAFQAPAVPPYHIYLNHSTPPPNRYS